MFNHKKIQIIYFSLVIIILISGCSLPIGKKQAGVDNMNLTNKRILMVVAPVNFRDKEYFDPKQVLERAGAEIKTASIQNGIARGADGAEVKIDLTVSEASENDFDAVVFIGGPGMAEIVGDESLQVLANKFYQKGKLTAAICVAPAILARAGILNGKQATAWSDVESDLKDGGAVFTGEPVTADGKIVTANGPQAAREFGEKIGEMLSE